MQSRERLAGLFRARKLTRPRIVFALVVALAADVLQVALLPVAWTFAQQIIDGLAMALTIWLLGFHPLLLPTFLLEFIPVVDAVPMWTGCVLVVIALRQRAGGDSPSPRDAGVNVNPPTPGLLPAGPAETGRDARSRD